LEKLCKKAVIAYFKVPPHNLPGLIPKKTTKSSISTAVIAYFKVPPHNLPGLIPKKPQNPLSVQSASHLTCELRMSQPSHCNITTQLLQNLSSCYSIITHEIFKIKLLTLGFVTLLGVLCSHPCLMHFQPSLVLYDQRSAMAHLLS